MTASAKNSARRVVPPVKLHKSASEMFSPVKTDDFYATKRKRLFLFVAGRRIGGISDAKSV